MKYKHYLYALSAAFTVTALWIYVKKGSARKVGEKLDRAGDRIQDVLATRGSAGKVGQKIDKVVSDVQDIAR